MNWDGWICMLTAVSSVTILFGWCCWKIMMDKGIEEPENENLEDDYSDYMEL